MTCFRLFRTLYDFTLLVNDLVRSYNMLRLRRVCSALIESPWSMAVYCVFVSFKNSYLVIITSSDTLMGLYVAVPYSGY
jgi:hypothetical protein